MASLTKDKYKHAIIWKHYGDDEQISVRETNSLELPYKLDIAQNDDSQTPLLYNLIEQSIFWPGFRKYNVDKPGAYADRFLQKLFVEIAVAFFAQIVILTAITILSLRNVIAGHLEEHIDQIRILEILGATRRQIVTGLSFQITSIALLGALIGMGLTIGLVTLLPLAQTIPVGGLIITPSFDLTHILLVLVGTVVPIYLVSMKETKHILALGSSKPPTGYK